MRLLALLIALLLIAPVLAQEGSSSQSSQGEKGSSSQQSPNERPDNRPDQRPDQRPENAGNGTPGNSQSGAADGRKMATFEGQHVTISYQNGTLSYAHEGTTWFTLVAPHAKATERGRQLTVEVEGGRFLFTDAANGHFSYKGADIALDFGEATVGDASKGQLVQLGDQTAWLLQQAARETFLTFHVREPSEQPEFAAALENRKLAARIFGNEVETYDDVNITVDTPERATPETPYRVVIGAELPEGRTVVLNLDQAQLQGPDLELRYFDLNDDGTETEVVFRQATDLTDVLEPTDDLGQPEYWVIKDENGLQVMVSIPHWSTHAVTLASSGSFVQPQVWMGALAGAVIAVVAGLALFRPRT